MNAIFKLKNSSLLVQLILEKNTLLDSQKRKNTLPGVLKKKKGTTWEPKKKEQSINTERNVA